MATLPQVNTKAAESLANPDEYPNLFPDWDVALKIEQAVMADAGTFVPAAEYPSVEDKPGRDLIAAFGEVRPNTFIVCC